MYNLVLVTVLMGPMSHAFKGEMPSRPPLAVTSSVLGTYQTLAECKNHIGAPTTDSSSFDSTSLPPVQQMTYCAGK